MSLKTAIKRKFKMGIFKNLSKIEELLESYVPGTWSIFHNALTVKDLPENMKNAMLQFGYTEDAVIFAVENEYYNDYFVIQCVCWGERLYDEMKSYWKKLLYKDVDRNWNVRWRKEDCKDNESLLKAIDECYRILQKFFMFMSIYLKQREQMIKLINIEWDAVIESTKDN